MSCNKAQGQERRSSLFPPWERILGDTGDPGLCPTRTPLRETGSSDSHLVCNRAPLKPNTAHYGLIVNKASKVDCSVRSQGPARTNTPNFPSARTVVVSW